MRASSHHKRRMSILESGDVTPLRASKGVKVRLYVNFPIPLAAAIGLEAGEAVEWELLSRGELHLVRTKTPKPKGRLRE